VEEPFHWPHGGAVEGICVRFFLDQLSGGQLDESQKAMLIGLIATALGVPPSTVLFTDVQVNFLKGVELRTKLAELEAQRDSDDKSTYSVAFQSLILDLPPVLTALQECRLTSTLWWKLRILFRLCHGLGSSVGSHNSMTAPTGYATLSWSVSQFLALLANCKTAEPLRQFDFLSLNGVQKRDNLLLKMTTVKQDDKGASWKGKCAMVEDTNVTSRSRSQLIPLQDKVTTLLGSLDFRSNAASKFGRHGKSFVEKLLHRTQMANRLGGPRMRVVWWRHVEQLGRLPKFSKDRAYILDLERLVEHWLRLCDTRGEVDGKSIVVAFGCHKWARTHYCERCSRGTCDVAEESSHPDTADHVKAKMISSTGRNQYDHGFDYFYFVDFAGVDQVDQLEKQFGIKMLPAYIAVSECLVLLDEPSSAWMSLEVFVALHCTNNTLYILDKSLDYSQGIGLYGSGAREIHVKDPLDQPTTVPADLKEIQQILDMMGKIPSFQEVDYKWAELKEKPVLGHTVVSAWTMGSNAAAKGQKEI